jgi:hypothetical protein
VIVAMRTGVAPAEWLDDPRALITALELLAEADADARRRG